MKKQKAKAKAKPLPKISPVGVLVKDALELYKKGFWKLIFIIFIGVLATLPIAILGGAGVGMKILSPQIRGGVLLAIFIVLGIIFVLFSIYFSFSSQAAIHLYFKKEYPKPGVWDIFNEARKNYFWRFLGLSVLSGLIFIVGFLLFVIPGVILLIYLAFTAWVLIFEEKGVVESIKGSAGLVKGYWWAVLGRFLAVYGVFYLIVALPEALIDSPQFAEFWSFVIQAISFVLTPFFLAFSYLIYKDLVKIKAKISEAK